MQLLRAWILFLLVAAFGCDRGQDPSAVVRPQTVAAQTTAKQTAQKSPDEGEDLAFRRPLLWKLEHPDVKHPSYIFGTIHAGFEVQWDTLPPSVRDAFMGSEVVMLEVALDDSAVAKVASMMTLPEDQSLARKLGTRRFERLTELTGAPPRSLDRFRPWVAHSALMEEWAGDEKPMDMRFMVFAEAHEKDMAYLETVAEQVKLLDRAVTADVLGQAIDDPDAQRQSLQAAISAYREGDIDGVIKATFIPDTPEQLLQVLFTERNARWLPVIDRRFRDRITFLAAGAGHFVGPRDNILDALKERGWTATRVLAPPSK